MKFKVTFLLLFLFLAVSCGKNTNAIAPNEPPKIDVPDVPKDDQDEKKYGKTILLGTNNYPITKFKKVKYNAHIDYMGITIDEPKKDGAGQFKLIAHVLRLDRKAFLEDISIEALMGGQYLSDRASPQNIMKNESNSKKRVLAIVNGDFFNTAAGGTMLGALVNNGRIIKTANTSWKLTYGMTKANEFFIDELNYTITVGEADYRINEINGSRSAGSLILYTTSIGEKTGANQYGSEILLKPVNGDWETLTSYDNVLCEVVSATPVAVDGGIAIPKGHIVLSGHGAGVAVTNRYKKGDQVAIKISKPKGKSGKVYDVKEAVGAAYPILAGGAVQTVTSTSGNPKGKEPRTSIGHSDKYFYMVAIEGRSNASDGLTVKELSYLLKHFDAEEAVNLDGGGSTMLAIGNNDIFGQPAGTTWFRPVPNAFAIVKYY